jgi:HD-GYP domain-containing protein (c-di-GMP phosphodiesterase class II)
MGDEVLRRVGHSLRSVVRPYDLCARYGGDEFALVCVDADEAAAAEIAGRALHRLSAALGDMDHAAATGATIGVACRAPGDHPTQVLEQADRALLFGKQEGHRGAVVPASSVPDLFRPGRFRREDGPQAGLSRGTEPEPGIEPGATQALRLQKRTRQLVLANALAARLAAMNDPDAIANAAVEELHRAFGYFLCAVIRLREDDYVESMAGRGEAFVRLGEQRWTQPRGAGIIGRALRDRRVVLVNDVVRDADYNRTAETSETRAELTAPLYVGDRLWGAINIEERYVDAFDEDDARLVQTVADLVGSALRSALLYEQLERAYLGTAEALSAAVEAKDASEHESIVAWCEAVARRLDVAEADLRDLRYAAALHDIGKLSIPEAILAKPGPLDPQERAIVERHPLVAEQILGPVEFLAPVRRLVRHEHERWDGAGYPDGLAGTAIPLASRIVFVCDAFQAMTSARPHRPALDDAAARAELEANAGTQFDPAVVAAFLAVLDGEAGDPAV